MIRACACEDIGLVTVLLGLALAPAASAKVRVSFERLKGFDAPGTPAKYDKVGALKVGPKKRATC